MSGFINADGSELAGGLTPTGNGQALKLDASGNLLVTSTGGGSGGTVTIADPTTPANKAAVDATGALKVEDQLRAWIINGQGFSATTGKLNAGASITAGFSVFNPAGSGKSILLYSVRLFYVGATAVHQFQLTTSDPAFGTGATISNNKAGGGSSAIASNVSYANANQSSLAGTAYDVIAASGGVTLELFANGTVLLLPSGSGNGLAAYLVLPSANTWAVTARWIEF